MPPPLPEPAPLAYTENMRHALLLLLACTSLAAHAEEVGRFFFTPQERQALDARHSGAPAPSADTSSAATPASDLGPDISVQGIVKRSSGKFTAWVNGTAYDEKSASHLLRSPGKSSAVIITAPEAKHSLTLKAGQSGSLSSGAITDAYQAPPASGSRQ